jgi:hypothetical protein
VPPVRSGRQSVPLLVQCHHERAMNQESAPEVGATPNNSLATKYFHKLALIQSWAFVHVAMLPASSNDHEFCQRGRRKSIGSKRHYNFSHRWCGPMRCIMSSNETEYGSEEVAVRMDRPFFSYLL